MTRHIRTLAFLAILSLAGCGKIKLPSFGKKAAPPTPAPVVAVAAATPAPATPGPAAPAPAPTAAVVESKPSPVAIDTKAQVVVLCYHRLEGKAGGALSIEADLFKKHMQEIKDRGLAVISMQDFLAWRRGEKGIPAKSVLITIDDGYLSGYEVGFPVLKQYGYSATYFVYTNYLNSGGKSMTWEQLAELRDAGMEIGCHTLTHPYLTRKPKPPADYDAWLKNEIETSKQIIEEKLGIKVATFAYPYGLHNEKVNAACKAAGYEAAFTTYGQRLGMTTPALTLGRFDVTTKDLQGHDSFSIAVGFQGMMAPSGGEAVLAQDAAVSMITEPTNGATINNPTPLLKANLATMGLFEAGSVEMRVSGIGKVPASYDDASKTITYKIAANQKLRPGPVSVIINAKSGVRRLETRWNFHFDPAATGGDATAGNEPLPARPPKR
jgi:peptidoglycan/xylan/chitin deacetylase (PgdA/CDA1 family)